jgi:hypothetical protein
MNEAFEPTPEDRAELTQTIEELRALSRLGYISRDPEYAAIVNRSRALVARNVAYLLPELRSAMQVDAQLWPDTDPRHQFPIIHVLLLRTVVTPDGARALAEALPQTEDVHLKTAVVRMLGQSQRRVALDAVAAELGDATLIPRRWGPPSSLARPRIKDRAYTALVKHCVELGFTPGTRRLLDRWPQERDTEISRLCTWLAENGEALDGRFGRRAERPHRDVAPGPQETEGIPPPRETPQAAAPERLVSPSAEVVATSTREKDEPADGGSPWLTWTLAVAGAVAGSAAGAYLPLRRRAKT